MPVNVICDEACHEEIRVVVTMLHAQRQILARFTARIFQQFRLQLLDEELIAESLVDKNVVEIAVA